MTILQTIDESADRRCAGDNGVNQEVQPAPGNPAMERLSLECVKCGNTAGKMQARSKA